LSCERGAPQLAGSWLIPITSPARSKIDGGTARLSALARRKLQGEIARFLAAQDANRSGSGLEAKASNNQNVLAEGASTFATED
jgi:hypothetical protein